MAENSSPVYNEHPWLLLAHLGVKNEYYTCSLIFMVLRCYIFLIITNWWKSASII